MAALLEEITSPAVLDRMAQRISRSATPTI
jgi:hypothetical protein